MLENKTILYGCGSDMELLQFMRSKGNDKYSRLDAFCDLVGRITGIMDVENNSDRIAILPFKYGTFQSSVSELADKWGWHRATVRNFLDKLEEMGYLKKQLFGRDYTFYMRLYTGVCVPIKDNEQVKTLFIHLLANHDFYELSNEQLAAYIDMYYVDVIKTYSGNDIQSDMARHKAGLILEAISNMAYSNVIIKEPDPIKSLIISSFEGHNSWTWLKWIAAMKLLDVALYSGNFPTGHIEEIGLASSSVCKEDFTDDEITFLKEIFSLLVKCAHSENKAVK